MTYNEFAYTGYHHFLIMVQSGERNATAGIAVCGERFCVFFYRLVSS